MAIKITASFDEGAFVKDLDSLRAMITEAVLEEYAELGLECTSIAKGVPSWVEGGRGFENVTGALRSSIGSAVFLDGYAVADTYREEVGENRQGVPLSGGSTGVTQGRMLAERIANQKGEELALVVTAAMPYAEELQALKGRDVLESAALHLRQEAPRIVDRIKAKLKGV